MDYCNALLTELSERLKAYPSDLSGSEYNIFQILGVEAREVVMCRFLADLLNPEGAHGMGTLFLRSFFQNVPWDCPMNELLLSHTEVVTEFVIDNDRRIDILLQNPRCRVPIEVKIYAGEQEGQCYDYCQYAHGAPMVYLTRFGDAPSGYSLKQKDGLDMLPLERVRCISWSRDIYQWLTGLLPELNGPAEPVVKQYIQTIRSIADERGHRLMEQSVQAALTSPEFFRAGLELERSMKQAKLTLMQLAFECFKQEMAPIAERYGLELERDTHYHSYVMPQHEKFYDCYSTYPGLNYVITRAHFQKSSLQLWFRIEVVDNLFAGIALFDTEAEPQSGYPKGYQVDHITPELLEETAQYLDRDIITPNYWWLTWCYPNGKVQDDDYSDVPNFKTVNQCATDFVDPQKRREYVRKAVQVFEANLLTHLLEP